MHWLKPPKCFSPWQHLVNLFAQVVLMNCKLYYVFILQELIQVVHWVFFEKGWALWGWGVSIFYHIVLAHQDFHGQGHNCIRNMKSKCKLLIGIRHSCCCRASESLFQTWKSSSRSPWSDGRFWSDPWISMVKWMHWYYYYLCMSMLPSPVCWGQARMLCWFFKAALWSRDFVQEIATWDMWQCNYLTLGIWLQRSEAPSRQHYSYYFSVWREGWVLSCSLCFQDVIHVHKDIIV